MQIRTLVPVALVALLFAGLVFGAPSSMGFIPTVNVIRTQTDNMNTLLLAADGDTAPGLLVAARVHLANAQRFLERDLAPAETASMTDAELAAYAQAMTDLLASLQGMRQTLAAGGVSSAGYAAEQQAETTTDALVATVQFQVDRDPRVFDAVMAPEGGTVWGTVWLRPAPLNP